MTTSGDVGDEVCRIVRTAGAVIVEVSENVTAILGWAPEDLVGKPSTNFVHPHDGGSAAVGWGEMITAYGESRTQRGRWRAANGEWAYVEATNTNQLRVPGIEAVVTELRLVDGVAPDVDEELRARKEILSRLADVLPVGIVQFDRRHQIVFANDQLASIVSVPNGATVERMLADVTPADQIALGDALARVLANEEIDDLELIMVSDGVERVLSIGLRPLTDSAGRAAGGIGCVSDVTEQVRLRRRLLRRATTDDLTGCLEREAILQFLEASTGEDIGTAVYFVDLDGFKQVNDTYGHVVGDHVLQLTVARLRECLRVGDEIGRLGGDEFLVVCPNVTNEAYARRVARRLTEATCRRATVDGHELDLATSVGFAWTADAVGRLGLVERADAAMYEAKRSRSA